MSLRIVLLLGFVVAMFLSLMLACAQTTPTGQVSSGCFNKVWYVNDNDSCPDIPADPKHLYKRQEDARELVLQYCLVCPFNCKGGKALPNIESGKLFLRSTNVIVKFLVKPTCLKPPGCSKRFIARYGCTALPDTGVTALPSRCPFIDGDDDIEGDC